VCEKEKESVCVCVKERERKKETEGVYVKETEGKKEREREQQEIYCARGIRCQELGLKELISATVLICKGIAVRDVFNVQSPFQVLPVDFKSVHTERAMFSEEIIQAYRL